MKAGERQVAPTLDGIRRDHVARYEFAAQRLAGADSVIDFGCGIGYGSKILASELRAVRAFDIDLEALQYGNVHYAHPYVERAQANGNAPGELGNAAAAVCFEMLEHIEDPRPLLLALRESAPLLIASVPNEDVIPFVRPDGSTTAFHHRHYTKFEFNELLAACGWCAVEWYGQEGPESEVEPNVNGRTIIAVAQRDALPNIEPATDDRPRHVAILALGPSVNEFLEIAKRKGGRSRFCDEVWAVNALGNVFDCDMVFHMDDVRIQEIRAAANPAGNIAAMLPWLKASKVPVVTSRAHPDYPALVEFPLEDVLNHLGHDYFNSTPAYAIALAIHIGVEELSLFGLDYTYPDIHGAEKGRACVEFWLGQAHARGIKIHLPKTTSLMDALHPRPMRLYGYDTRDVGFDVQPDGRVKLVFTEREQLPTAAEIEAAYDHSGHPNVLATEKKG